MGTVLLKTCPAISYSPAKRPRDESCPRLVPVESRAHKQPRQKSRFQPLRLRFALCRPTHETELSNVAHTCTRALETLAPSPCGDSTWLYAAVTAELFMRRGVCYFFQGRPEEGIHDLDAALTALEILDKGTKKHQLKAKTLVWKGICLLQLDLGSEALECLEDSLHLEPRPRSAIIQLIIYLRSQLKWSAHAKLDDLADQLLLDMMHTSPRHDQPQPASPSHDWARVHDRTRRRQSELRTVPKYERAASTPPSATAAPISSATPTSTAPSAPSAPTSVARIMIDMSSSPSRKCRRC